MIVPRLLLYWRRGADCNDTPAASDYLAVFQCRSCMEYNAVFNLFYSADGKSLVIMLRISAGYQHDAYCRTGVYLQDFFIQIACCRSFKQFHQVTLDAQHDTFRFRVAHAYIVFNDHRFALYIN